MYNVQHNGGLESDLHPSPSLRLAWDAENNVVLTDGEGNVLAADWGAKPSPKPQTVRARCWTPTATSSRHPRGEGNNIVDGVEGSGSALDSNGSTISVGDAETGRRGADR